MIRRAFAVALAALSFVPFAAWADGAFPDENGIFAPVDRPNQIVVPTNFGLAITNDDAMHWNWVCEGAIATMPSPYFMGPPPSDIVSAISIAGTAYVSTDFCSWTAAAFSVGAVTVSDIFPDPSDPMHVLALARTTSSATAADNLFESRDGGRTYPKALFTAPSSARLESVELAKSDSHRLYLVMTDGRPARRFLLRSSDAGSHWSMVDVSDALRPSNMPMETPHLPLIARVDPMNADVIYFRVVRTSASEADALALSTDGGVTIKIIFTLANMGKMTAFLLLPDGTIILGSPGGGYVSTDRGVTFKTWDNSPGIRGLAYRNGNIYASADNFADGYAAGVTSDLGTSWTALFRFDQLGPPLSCPQVQNACDPLYPGQCDMFGIDGCVGNSNPDGGMAKPSGKGCGCGVLPPHAESSGFAFPLLIASLVLALRKRSVARALVIRS